MKRLIKNIRKYSIWSIGVAVALSPVAAAASCGSSDADVPKAQSIDTSQVNLNGVSISGTVTSPVVSLGGTYLPDNTSLRYKVGASEWLDEAAFKAYVVTNASKLADADLSAVKVRLIATSDKYIITSPKEETLGGKISRIPTTPAAISIDTSAVNLSVITVSGTVTAPVINLNGFTTPANTILLFQVGLSSWLNEAGIKAYIIDKGASLTTTQLSAVKAHLEAASVAYSLTSSREVTLTGSILKVVNTDAANLNVITISGSTASPVINLNGFATPDGAALLFQIGSSAWLNEAGIKDYIILNAGTLTLAELSAVKAHLEAASNAYSLTSSREVTLGGSILKVVNTSAANLNAITISGSTTSPVINLNGFTTPTGAVLLFQAGPSAWLNQVDTIAYVVANSATLTIAQLSAVKARLEPISTAYTLSNGSEVTLTGTIKRLVDTSTSDLSVITVGGVITAPTINLNGFITPTGAALRFQVGPSTWLTQAEALDYIIANASALSTLQLSEINASLEPASSAYTLTSNNETTLPGRVKIVIDTSAIDLSKVTLAGTLANPRFDNYPPEVPHVLFKFRQTGNTFFGPYSREQTFERLQSAKNFVLNPQQFNEIVSIEMLLVPASDNYILTSDRLTTVLLTIVYV